MHNKHVHHPERLTTFIGGWHQLRATPETVDGYGRLEGLPCASCASRRSPEALEARAEREHEEGVDPATEASSVGGVLEPAIHQRESKVLGVLVRLAAQLEENGALGADGGLREDLRGCGAEADGRT